MSEYLVKVIIAGVLFGFWPLLIGKSGLSTGTATALFSATSFLVVTSFAIMNGVNFSGGKWWWAIIAGSMAALGVLAFNDVMIKAKPTVAPMMFVIMLVIQVTVPAAYHVAANQQFSPKTIVGFIAAIIACILLSR
jgi:hypothetical protein